MNIIDTIEREGMKQDLPQIAIGDQVKVNVKVVEGTRERIQTYEGTVIAKKNGVERTFPIHSPKIDSIQVVRHGKVRRAKLYYLKNRTGKAAKLKEV